MHYSLSPFNGSRYSAYVYYVSKLHTTQTPTIDTIQHLMIKQATHTGVCIKMKPFWQVSHDTNMGNAQSTWTQRGKTNTEKCTNTCVIYMYNVTVFVCTHSGLEETQKEYHDSQRMDTMAGQT
jgi:hypothetical protein